MKNVLSPISLKNITEKVVTKAAIKPLSMFFCRLNFGFYKKGGCFFTDFLNLIFQILLIS